MSGLAHRADAFRLRAESEASILPVAASIDGRRFSFQAGLNFGRRVASQGAGDVDAGWARPG